MFPPPFVLVLLSSHLYMRSHILKRFFVESSGRLRRIHAKINNPGWDETSCKAKLYKLLSVMEKYGSSVIELSSSISWETYNLRSTSTGHEFESHSLRQKHLRLSNSDFCERIPLARDRKALREC
jgi:hypothetical protein